jgi:hypothetical protein
LCTHAAALDFCIEWFDSNTKENSKSIENCFENFEKKKEREFSLLLPSLFHFRPVWPCSHARVTPDFKELNQVSHICVQKVHTYVRMKKYQKQYYLFNVHIAILTLTSEYRGMMTKLQAPFLSGTTDWWLRMPSTSERFLETPLYLHSSSKQHLTTHWGVGEITRVGPCQTQQV